METEDEFTERDGQYTSIFECKCPTDSSKVTHTVVYKKATCTRVDDIILHFKCSRDSKCVKCYENYR